MLFHFVRFTCKDSYIKLWKRFMLIKFFCCVLFKTNAKINWSMVLRKQMIINGRKTNASGSFLAKSN